MHRVLIAHTPLGETWWATNLEGDEALGALYTFYLSLKSNNSDIDCQALIGEMAAVELEAQRGIRRYFSGQIVNVSAQGQRGEHWAYEAVIAPKLWHASRRSDFKIWQNLTVRDIATEVLGNNAIRFEWRLKYNYKTWEYLVQYGETDLDFLSRLFAHEGIYYWFEHGKRGETLILGDHFTTHEAFGGYENIPFYPPDEARADEDHYFGWHAAREPEPGRFMHRDYDFKRPWKDLTTEYYDPRGHLFDHYERYFYPGNYTEPDDGRSYAAARLETLQRKQDVIALDGRVRGAIPGCRFTLRNHPRADQNRELVITKAHYEIANNDYEGASGTDDGAHFRVEIEALPANRQYRTEHSPEKPRAHGPETAVVVGPAGSEIHTDQYGRVKVHFHWDRYGQKDGRDSCWIRVAYPWAGVNFGSIHIPRVGQEVIVDYEYGDPDRPIITGRVYNARQMPPWDLPANQTQSGILTRSSPEGMYSNANAIRFEDAKGREELWLHAERDQRIEVENCENHSVGANRNKSVGNDESTSVGRNRTQQVGGKHVEIVDKDIAVYSQTGNIVTTALAKSIKLEAAEHIVFKVGGSAIIMNADGTIQIYGAQRVDINPDGVKVPGIRAAVPGEDDGSELLDESEVMGDAEALGTVAATDVGSIGAGSATTPTPFELNKRRAIDNIKNSRFGQTAEGVKVVAKIEELDNAGKIKSETLDFDVRGSFRLQDGAITVNSSYASDPDVIASELVHEATHAVHREGLPASTTNTVDEEVRTNENQLDFYEEQRAGSFKDLELERRRTARAAGKLRDNVRSRYPDIPEHL
ncbi:MAG: type VI secretion system tip protein VgrG [Azoarcus sp.]|jgi:type VI secretion system secreted protein VgrG|nr:type VI secretion system tip protein VgrG [Azoarcus sp.]